MDDVLQSATSSGSEMSSWNLPHPLTPYPPVLINACLTGMIPTKGMTEFVPVTPEEIAADAVRVFDAGARIVHVHARDESGAPTWRAEIYDDILTRIRRERPELICCVSSSGRLWSDFERRSEVLAITGAGKPDMASLTLGSMNFPTGPSVNSIDMIERLAQTMNEHGIRPELEVFDLGMADFAQHLVRKKFIATPNYFNLLLGSLGAASATIGHLSCIVAALPLNSVWAGAGIGRFQMPMNVAALVAGGGVRVGIEDNIHYDYERTKLATNEDLVKRIVRIATELGRRIAAPTEARHMVGLKKTSVEIEF